MIQAARTHSRVLTPLFLALALAAPAIAQQEKDVVRLKDGKSESGKIKSEDYGGLVITVGKEEKTIAWNDILPEGGITYAGPGSVQYQSAKEIVDQGKLEDAAAALTELKGEKQLRAVLKQNVLYYLGYVQQRQSKLDEALGTYKELLTEFPKSRYLMMVGENLVTIHLAKKDVAGAMKALDQLSADAAGAGVECGFGASVSVLKGRVLEEQKKYPEAQAQYVVAEKSAGVAPSVVAQAVLGQGRCAVAMNKKPEAEGLFRKLVTQDGPNVVVAGAWNGLGDLMFEEGKPKAAGSKGDPERILDALYCYLRDVVQYAPLPGEPTTEYERSLALASDCFKWLATLETKADMKVEYKKRSDARLEQLKSQFPNSPFREGR